MQDAQKRYNDLYDNAAYQAVTQAIADDLNVDRESLAASDAANMLTDAALGLCGHPSYAESCLTLAIFCGRSGIRPTTIDAIFSYLSRFQQTGDNRTDDFEATAKALHHIQSVQSILPLAVSHTNGIHSWRGRTAYDLLASADYIIRAAENLLRHGDDSYVAEKIRAGVGRIIGASREAIRYANRPQAFDLSDTHFPSAGTDTD